MSPQDRSAAASAGDRPGLQRGPDVTAPNAKSAARQAALSKRLSVSFHDGEDETQDGLGCFGRWRKNHHFKPAIPTSEEELEKVEERCGPGSWQLRLVKFINCDPVQKLLVSLLLCDVLILFTELYLDASYPSCHTISRDAISCCPADCKDSNVFGETDENKYDDGHGEMYDDGHGDEYDDGHGDKHDDGHRFLGGGGYGYCEYPLKDTYFPAGCDDHKYEGVHKAHTILFSFTIGILSFFMIEILTLVVCLGPKLFFSRFLYVLDFLVIGSSLALEIVFALMDDTAAADVAGLLVVFRLWRFIRIGHGLVASTHEMAAHKMNKLKKYTRALEEEVIRCGGVLPESKWSLGLLESAVSNHVASESDDSVKKISVEIGGRVVNSGHLVSKRMVVENTGGESLRDEVDDKDSFVDNALAA